jgi:hypothetical protein
MHERRDLELGPSSRPWAQRAIPHRRDELPDEPNDTLAKRQNVRVRDVRHEAVRGHEW